jgi:alanine racemase
VRDREEVERVNELNAWVEVDLDAFASNLRRIRAIVGPDVRLHLVVKADAYGHGASRMADVAGEEGVHSLGVATLDEGAELRRDGIRLPILILSPTTAPEAARIVANRLSPTVGNVELARAVSAASVGAGIVTPVQVEVDTGMGRSGVSPSEAPEFVRTIAAMPGLEMAGLFTHFPRADAPEGRAMSERQIEDFRLIADDVRAAGVDPGLLHAANSAAVVNLPRSHYEMVRLGILAYGLVPSEAVPEPDGLKPVMRFVSRLVHVRELPAGHAVSYGADFVTPERMRVGTVAVGYGGGYPFALSGRGYALLRGRRVPILGRVTMDTTVFDLRGVPEARLGDEVVLFGRQGDELIRASDLATLASTIPYEILCGIGRRVPRVYTRVGRRVALRTLLGHQVHGPSGGDR